MSIVGQVNNALRRVMEGQSGQGGFSQGNSLIIAVSGGPDSLCLLHLLCQGTLIAKEQLIVVHLNHGLRRSAGDEAAFVREFSTQHHVRSIIKKSDVAALARTEGLSLEEAGRQARYQFFSEVARENDAQYVVTGHNADDQVETIVMHMLRGSAMPGLRGMQSFAPLPGSPDLTLIRPLLQVNRQEIEDYCLLHHLTPVIDESNQDKAFYRNRLRHELIPLLDEYNPGFHQRVQDMAVIFRDEDNLLEDIAGREWKRLLLDQGPGWLRLSRMGWRSIPVSLQRRLVRKAVLALLPDLRNVGFRTTEQAREVAAIADIGATSTLPAGVSLTIDYDHLLFSTEEATVPDPNLPQLKNAAEFHLPVPGRLTMENGWIIQAQMLADLEPRRAIENKDPWQAFVVVEDPADIMVRTRRAGERFQPLGMADGSAKVSRVMIDRKIPQRLRAKWPIVANQKHLLWLVGHHIDARAKVGRGGQNILFLQVYKEVDA